MLDTALQGRVQAILDEEVAGGAEVGLQAAVYRHGELVVDAWAGTADAASGRRVDGDTLFTCFSTTKGIAATCLHVAAEQGKVEYDAPVARYWPEFAAAGKAAITVRQVLCHMAGVPQMPVGLTVETAERMTDWDAMTAAIAAAPPMWVPGTATAYHTITFGWLVGEIVRRADGRPLAQFLQEEICRPLGITGLYLGVPDEALPWVATLVNGNFPPPTAPESLYSLAAAPQDLLTPPVWNRADVRRASIPGAGGIMNARSIARHYALLAGWGELDGVRLLSRSRVEEMRSLQTAAVDLTIGRVIYKGMGYFKGGLGNDSYELALGERGTTFGHPGHGGSIGWADPELGLAMGFTKALLNNYADARRNPVYKVAEAVRGS